MKVLIVGQKSKKQDIFCIRLKKLHPDAELVFDRDIPKQFPDPHVAGYWLDECATIHPDALLNLITENQNDKKRSST